MIVDEINALKEVLNKQLEEGNLNSDQILLLSQTLDKLIVEYYIDNKSNQPLR